jgi:hypothetical protein
MATLTVINFKLAMQLEASQAYIKKLKEKITYLTAKTKPAWHAGPETSQDDKQ